MEEGFSYTYSKIDLANIDIDEMIVETYLIHLVR